MKYCYILFLFLLAGQCAQESSPAKMPDVEEMNGLSFVAPPKPFEKNPMKAIKALGTDWVAVIPYAYTRVGDPSVIYNTHKWQWWGERPEGAIETIRLAKTEGLKVMLKPQVYIPRSWTGDLDFPTDKEWTQWEEDYERYILPFATIADSLNVPLFCIGTEFKINSKKRPKFWRQLSKKIRKVYKGKLVYAANWDEFQDITFWEELDFIGINAYFPLLNEKTPSVTALKKAWQPHLKMIRDFQQKTNRPIIFTEWGYLSVDGCAYNTWELEGKIHSLDINQQAQANAIDALYSVFSKEPYWCGGFIWKWYPNNKGGDDYDNRDYTPQGKLGAEVLKKWFTKEKE